MEVPPPGALLERVRSLPAARPLLDRVGDQPGVHLVGGAVRDLLIGGEPYDLDLVAEGDEAAEALARRLGGERREHERFGTSSISLDGFTYHIARSRRERYAAPGALPEVAPAPLAEDLLRRDFTVNAGAITLGGPKAGELTSAPSALEDLEARRLRVLHDRSFLDDPTRLLRLARYASRLAFEIEPRTLELARTAVAAGALATVSGSRIGAELRLLAQEPNPVAALEAIRELALDTAIDPAFRLEDPRLAERALELLPADGRRDRLALALASGNVPRARLSELLERLSFAAADRDAIVAAAAGSRRLADDLERARTPSQIAVTVTGAEPELVALAGALGPARQARDWLERLRHVRLEIDGAELLAAGVPEGPAIGRGLRAALAAKLDATVSGHDEELAEALRAAR